MFAKMKNKTDKQNNKGIINFGAQHFCMIKIQEEKFGQHYRN